jgi:hypothetical protein
MSFESLLFLAVLAAITFVKVLLPWLRRQADAVQPGPPGAEPVDESRADEADDQLPVAATPAQVRQAPAVSNMAQARVTRGRTAPAAAHSIRGVDRRAVLAPLNSLAEARRGIVLRSMLGPCRAQEPFDGSVN